MQRGAHLLRSYVGYIGADEVFEIARRIELLEASEMEKSLPSLINELQDAFTRLRDILEWLKNGMEA